MRLRSQAEEVHHRLFAIEIPPIREEPDFRPPTMRQQRGVFGEPCPINPVEDVIAQAADFGITEMLTARENATQQNCSIDGRSFRIPDPLTGYDIGPVKKEAAVCWHFFPQEAKGSNGSIPRV